ncbi:zinc-binding dehydrogenase [Lentilactobacillus diolivorans]|uniref:zinc-binding dehydrogenase n=1 Tax=Lentilactobacillus diolivorans TaxID=179838 RepID=UPI0024687433|nr:zinc-binding dehydrogenase [Lentilactobacillus diolivorans]MDH5106141.1 zinc-binding dehydrogenase [Lentilactobacillus diolivorans]
MKAIVISGKGKIDLTNVTDLVKQANQVIFSPKFVGICGSDLHYLADGSVGQSVIREPLIPGHEVSGTLDESVVIDGNTIPQGTKITVHPATFGDKQDRIAEYPEIWPNGRYLGSAQYLPHTQGGMVEKMAVRPDQVRVVPDNVSLESAALAEPLSVGLHAIQLAGGVKDKKVLVSGAGPIGLLAAGGAVTLGANSVTVSDVLDEPLARAKRLGVQRRINVTKESLPTNEFDLILECSGAAPAISASFKAAALGATIMQVGMMIDQSIPLNISSINGKELTYRGSFRFKNEIDQALQILSKNPVISTVITQIFKAGDYRKAFEVAKDAKQSAKVLIEM